MSLLAVSHQKQRQQADCLAACAAMVLNYLHVPIDYNRLLRLLRTQSHGTAFSNLRNLIEPLGLHVLVAEGTIETLRAHLNRALPPIVAVNTNLLTYWHEDTDHALVVVGIDEHFIYVNDPEFDLAPQAIPLQEFESAWVEQDYRYAIIGLDQIS